MQVENLRGTLKVAGEVGVVEINKTQGKNVSFFSIRKTYHHVKAPFLRTRKMHIQYMYLSGLVNSGGLLKEQPQIFQRLLSEIIRVEALEDHPPSESHAL